MAGRAKGDCGANLMDQACSLNDARWRSVPAPFHGCPPILISRACNGARSQAAAGALAAHDARPQRRGRTADHPEPPKCWRCRPTITYTVREFEREAL